MPAGRPIIQMNIMGWDHWSESEVLFTGDVEGADVFQVSR